MPDVALETARVFPSLLVRARARLRENLGRRAIGAALALAIEALLFWALISIGEIELPGRRRLIQRKSSKTYSTK